MKKTPPPTNSIKSLCEKKDISSRELAKLIGTSAPHMSRLINGKSPLTTKWVLKIATVLKVPTSRVVGLDLGKTFTDSCDDMLLGSIMGWLMEAADECKLTLKRSELTRLTSFIYKEAIDQNQTYDQTAHFTFKIIEALKISRTAI